MFSGNVVIEREGLPCQPQRSTLRKVWRKGTCRDEQEEGDEEHRPRQHPQSLRAVGVKHRSHD